MVQKSENIKTEIEKIYREEEDVQTISACLDVPPRLVRDIVCTEEELERLYKEENLTQREIADKMGLTQPAISRRMNIGGIETESAVPWSDKEEIFLKENYQDLSRRDLVSALPRRTWSSIKGKARDLGVAKSIEKHRHSDEVIERLRSNAEQSLVNIDFEKKATLSYILGVLDGDGFHDRNNTVGLEVNSSLFAEKFSDALESVGMNPGRGKRRGNRETVWGSSKRLLDWIMEMDDEEKLRWIKEEGDGWKYIEGRYESDGNIHPSGSPRICSYDEKAKTFLEELFTFLGIECSIQQNNVWVSIRSAGKFFENIDPVIRQRESNS